MSATKTTKTTPALMNVLVAVRQAQRTTAKQIDTNAVYLLRLQDQGLVKVVARVQSGKRGRPAHVFACTDKGRKRADRAIKAAA